MKKKLTAAALIFLMCILAAIPALAADVFRFAEDAVQVYAGESITPELIRDGKFADGTVTYSLNKTIAEVDENGTLTGINLGQLYLTAVLEQDGRQVKNAHTLVTVCRKVTKVTLNTNGLQVFEPDDERILPLLKPEEDGEPVTDQILVLPVGRKFWPRATVLPEDVANVHKKVTFETSDDGILTFSREGQFIASQPMRSRISTRMPVLFSNRGSRHRSASMVGV